MKKLEKMIVFMVVIILIIVILLIINIIKQNKKENEIILKQGETRIVGKNRKVLMVDSFQIYFQLDNCVSTFIEYVNNKNFKPIKSILIDDYSQQKYIGDNINLDNYIKFMNSKYTIREIFSLDSTFEKPYFIKGELINFSDIELKFFVVFLDVENNTFSIKEITEEEYQQMINGIFQFEEISINANEYNKIEKNYFSEEEIIKKFFYDYIENIVYAPTYAYKSLNKRYKEKKFGDYHEYKDYLISNIENYKLMEQNRAITRDNFDTEEEYNEYLNKKFYSGFYKYKINKYEDYTQYICLDFNNNYYIFNVKPDFTYDVILDTYTIDLPQFTEKYNSSNAQQKVAMNIDKFVKSLNDKDYKYAYNCLADGFKNNRFNSIDIFEKYMKKNIFEENKIEFLNFKNEGETYIFNVILKNANNQNEMKNMQIIMKLNEGTNFVMSFNFN